MQNIKDLAAPLLFIVILLLSIFGINKSKELHEMYLVEKAEHEVDTMTVMKGVYASNGHIITEDGHEWIYLWKEPKPVDTEVTVIFQTNNKPEQKWEIVTVQ